MFLLVLEDLFHGLVQRGDMRLRHQAWRVGRVERRDILHDADNVDALLGRERDGLPEGGDGISHCGASPRLYSLRRDLPVSYGYLPWGESRLAFSGIQTTVVVHELG